MTNAEQYQFVREYRNLCLQYGVYVDVNDFESMALRAIDGAEENAAFKDHLSDLGTNTVIEG